ncbi:MAG: HEPN domain-containing protein [Victivallaceae bacterium]|nr:HEPN domain-containing protein [Victivallaceae bacterium]
MKETPAHLPPDKQNELKRIVSTVRAHCEDVEMIILFGSYARGDYKVADDLRPGRKSGHESDYDILVVTGGKATALDTGLWDKITAECRRSGLSAQVQLVSHDIQELNIKLAQGQYFYSDVRKEGCRLYDSGNFKLARKRKLKPMERQRLAQDHFDSWFDNAEKFLKGFKFYFNEGDYRQAAFLLHQVTESSYKAVLLVFTNYSPNEHLLDILGGMAAGHEAALADIFPKETGEERDRFKLLDYAYIGARYDPAYRISREDLEYLSRRVKLLLELTKKICKSKIAGF